MRRNAGFFGFAVATGLWASAVQGQTREAESRQVYSAAFDFLFGQFKGEAPGTIVLMDTTSYDVGSLAYNGVLNQPHSSLIDPETIRDFEAQNRRPGPVTENDFSYRIPVVLLPLPEYFRLDTLGRKILKDDPYNGPQPGILMDAFVRKFPGAWGITVVSRVGFNSARTEALVLVAHQCGACYHSETLLFRKYSNKWALQERIPFMSRDGLGPGQARYLGIDPRALPRLRTTQDSTRKAIADSLARAKLPRRIRGTISSRQTGRPIPFAQVLYFEPRFGANARTDSIPHPDQRSVADNRGRYTLSNPEPGPAMLVILCPGPIYFDRPSLGVPAVYVYPGTDTTFNFAAQDLSACWKTTRTHQLQSGWFESTEARSASVPEEEESRVLRTVVQSLQEWQHEQPVVAMFTTTNTRCRFNRLCGSLQLPRLLHERIIDSSTATDFRSKTSRSVVMNPAFASSLGLHVITDAEFKYLSGEAEWPLGWPARDAETDSTRFWKSFRKLYGERATIAHVTRVGFNADRTQALVEARVDTAYEPWSRRAARMMILQRTGDQWIVVNRSAGGGALSGVIEGGACVASSVPSQPVLRAEIEKLEGLFELTIVRAGDEEVTDKAFLRIAGIPGNIVKDPRLIQVDGAYQNLTILSITQAGFSGSYVSGAFGDSDFGYFCARRVSGTR